MQTHSHITLSQLQRLVKETLHERFALPVWVSAEISEIKVNYSGHCYLELVEKGGDNGVPLAQSRAVIWRTAYPRIAGYFEAETGQRLAAGIKILAKVAVNYHELYGFSLQITDIDPTYTLGDMERQRQITIAQLQQEGVWDMNREAPMPVVVQRVAVVSSANAAGYQDFRKELAKSPYRFDVTLFDAFMQGAAAEESIVAALCAVAERMDEFDAVVLIRGGGSASDLNCFNAYRLCAHVAQFPLPILTGIGHDKDTSVADMVAPHGAQNPDSRSRMARRTDDAGRGVARLRGPATARCHESRHACLRGAAGTAHGRPAPDERRPAHAAAAPRGTPFGPAAGSGAQFPRTAGHTARQRRGTDRRPLSGTYPPAGLRRRPHGRQSRGVGPRRPQRRRPRNRSRRRHDPRHRATQRAEIKPQQSTPFRNPKTAAVNTQRQKTDMAKKEMTYAEAMAQIEKILARFRNEEMDVDSLAAEVKRATELIAGCKSRLRKAEEEVSKILES